MPAPGAIVRLPPDRGFRRGQGRAIVKHAGAEALDALDELIAAIRAREGLREPRRGVFYRRGKAWLHVHEDPAGLFADLRDGADWTRLRVSTATERKKLLVMVDRRLKE
jgi:hypothetical protein